MVDKYGMKDWFAGWSVAVGTGNAYLPSAVLTDATGVALGTAGNPLVTSGASGASSNQVQGTAASGATTVGNPVKVGAVYNTTLPTFTNGQVGDLQFAPRGQLFVAPGQSFTAADGKSNSGAIGLYDQTGTGGQALATYPFLYNGTNWDRQPGDVRGIYVSSFTPARINAAATTVVKGTPGVLHSIIVNTKGTVASTITVYNNTAGSGTVVAIIDSLNLSGTFLYDITMSTGITVVTTGTVAPDITVAYR